MHGWKIGLAKVQQGLYYLPWHDPIQAAGSKVATVKTPPQERIMEIHQRMGHPSFYLLKLMYPHLFDELNLELLICDACQLGKFKRTTYPISNNRTNKPFQLIHCDVWGPSPHDDLLGNRYFLICTDDHSRFSWFFLLKAKSEVTTKIINLCKLIQRQFGSPILGLRTDNAKDFLNQKLSEFLASEGIKHETSCPYTPQQNGLAERKIRDIVDKSRTLLIQASAPQNLWGFAAMTAVHLINRLPTKSLDLKSPLEILENRFPDVRLKTGLPVKIFGCVVYVHNPVHKNNKWSTKALKCVFLGYSQTQKGYKVYHPISRKYLVTKDVIFDEKSFYYQSNKKELRDLPYFVTLESDNSSLHMHDSQESHEPREVPEFQLQDVNPSSIIPDIIRDGPRENQEFHSMDNGTIVPCPKYYVRKKKPTQLEPVQMRPLSENQSETEAKTDKGEDGWPIALRKEKRSCVKSIPYAITHCLNLDNVSP